MAKKKKIYSRITVDEFNKFTFEFKNESDRAAVILGASKLDLLLYQLIEGFLLPNTSGTDELLDGENPLSTFSSRINICYRLGLIDAEFARALHLVRKIRNSFAHEVSSVSLDSGSHRDRIRELIAPFVSNWAFIMVLEKGFEGEQSPGTFFRAVIAILSLRLDGAVERIKRISHIEEPESMLPPERDKIEDETEEVDEDK